MTDDRELREAFRSLVENPRVSSADVLAGMQPRFRRARLARRAGAAALAVPMIAGLGFALTSLDGPSEVTQTVSTDGAPAVVDDLVLPVPEGTPEPPVDSAPDDDVGVDGDDPAQIGEPSTIAPETEDSPTPDADETPATNPTAGPTPEPDATPSPTPRPTTPATASMQYSSAGGTVDVEYTSTRITDVVFSPAPGFTGVIEKLELHEAKVIFSGPGDDIEIEIHLEDGALTFDESGD
jgi:hypothetical protein